MVICRRKSFLFACLIPLILTIPTNSNHTAHASEDDKPDFSLRASPRVAFAPTEILFVAELRNGSDFYEQFYCATIEWDWDDATRSESTPDCEPYEPGVTKIRRRYSVRHRFDYAGRYTIRVHLKRRDDTIASARTVIELRGGRDRRFN